MKLFPIAVISTILVIGLGVSLVSQVFYSIAEEPMQVVMISISINDDTNLPQWCDDLASILRYESIKATVFVAGKVAESHPDCVKELASNKKIDLGSTTYSYVSLTSIPEYLIQLEEVQSGKKAVDSAGNIDSRVFKGPFGHTNDDIYSLLNRSSIIADFSYQDHYNKVHGGYYIWFNATSYQVLDPSFYLSRGITDTPIIINFDNHDPIDKLDQLILQLKSSHFYFVNASELTQLELTIRGKNYVD